jgi:hypothetical protein
VACLPYGPHSGRLAQEPAGRPRQPGRMAPWHTGHTSAVPAATAGSDSCTSVAAHSRKQRRHMMGSTWRNGEEGERGLTGAAQGNKGQWRCLSDGFRPGRSSARGAATEAASDSACCSGRQHAAGASMVDGKVGRPYHVLDPSVSGHGSSVWAWQPLC